LLKPIEMTANLKRIESEKAIGSKNNEIKTYQKFTSCDLRYQHNVCIIQEPGLLQSVLKKLLKTILNSKETLFKNETNPCHTC
jgi:hypothetical protein